MAAALYDPVVICEYLDGLGGAPRLFPAAGPARIESLRRHALGNGAMDFLLLWRGELGRAAPDQRILDNFAAKLAALLAALEAEAPALSAGPFDIGRVAIGCALVLSRLPLARGRLARDASGAWRPGMPASPPAPRCRRPNTWTPELMEAGR